MKPVFSGTAVVDKKSITQRLGSNVARQVEHAVNVTYADRIAQLPSSAQITFLAKENGQHPTLTAEYRATPVKGAHTLYPVNIVDGSLDKTQGIPLTEWNSTSTPDGGFLADLKRELFMIQPDSLMDFVKPAYVFRLGLSAFIIPLSLGLRAYEGTLKKATPEQFVNTTIQEVEQESRNFKFI